MFVNVQWQVFTECCKRKIKIICEKMLINKSKQYKQLLDDFVINCFNLDAKRLLKAYFI